MKILWLSHLIPYPPKGGVLQRSYNLVKEISRYHEVDLLAFNQKELIGPLFESVSAGVEEARIALSVLCRRLSFFEIASDCSTYGAYTLALKSLFHEPYNINWLKSKAFAATMTSWLEQEKYDLVHFDTISLVPFFSLLPPVIATTLDHHNIESHMLLRRSARETNVLKRLYFWQEGVRLAGYERRYCPQFSLNITCSDIDKKRLLGLAPQSKVLSIPNGVDLDFFKPVGLPIHPNRLIFVGTMNWYPNVEAVLYIADNLWPRLKKMHPNLTFDVIGANPPDKIRSLADRFADFHIHGFVDDVRPFIETATVYVCPIRDGGGTKLKILDAMAMAKAVVAHPVACEGINVTHDKNILLADDDTSFINHIDSLLNTEDRRYALGMAARKLIEQYYGYHAIGEQLSNAYRDCVWGTGA
ncbi:MAG: glycosyltransferase [Desulfobulbaceae bacterium]|nr:glycosyltransferase [Desulfobulbaceae bacterium]